MTHEHVVPVVICVLPARDGFSESNVVECEPRAALEGRMRPAAVGRSLV